MPWYGKGSKLCSIYKPELSPVIRTLSKDDVLIIFSLHLLVPWPWSGLTSSGLFHYDDVIMSVIASQITSLAIVYSTVYSGADQRKHQSSASLAFVRGLHRGPVNSPHKWPVTRKMFPFDDVIMLCSTSETKQHYLYVLFNAKTKLIICK